MRISRQLYTEQYAAPKRAEILRELWHGGPLPFVYVLTRAVVKEGLIDVYAVRDFRSGTIQRGNPLFIGVTTGKEKAFRATQTIITELYVRNGMVNIDVNFDISDT